MCLPWCSEPHTKTFCGKTHRAASNQHYLALQYHLFLKAGVRVLPKITVWDLNSRYAEDHWGKQTVPPVPSSLQTAQCKATSALLFPNDTLTTRQKWLCLLFNSSIYRSEYRSKQPSRRLVTGALVWFPECTTSQTTSLHKQKKNSICLHKSWQITGEQKVVTLHICSGEGPFTTLKNTMGILLVNSVN